MFVIVNRKISMETKAELTVQERHLFRCENFCRHQRMTGCIVRTYGRNLSETSHTSFIFPVPVKNELSIKVQWHCLISPLQPPILNANPSHIKLTQPQMDTISVP